MALSLVVFAWAPFSLSFSISRMSKVARNHRNFLFFRMPVLSSSSVVVALLHMLLPDCFFQRIRPVDGSKCPNDHNP